MREIIIASANRQSAEKVRTILQNGRFFVNNIFSSGSEVLSYASLHPDALAVCGKLNDMSAAALAELLPSEFDLIVLLPSGVAQTVFLSNTVCLNMPVNYSELLDTVGMLTATAVLGKKERTEKPQADTQLIETAKKIIMSRHHISEREAHKLLQRRSMETGLKISQLAKMIAEGNNEIY